MSLKKYSLIIKKLDWFLLADICLLVILGSLLMYSVALGSQSEQNYLNFKKQIAFFILGAFLIFIIAFFLNYRFLSKANYIIYISGVILLIFVLVLGKTTRGTTGWFDLGFLSFQPVEFVKIILIIYLILDR